MIEKEQSLELTAIQEEQMKMLEDFTTSYTTEYMKKRLNLFTKGTQHLFK